MNFKGKKQGENLYLAKGRSGRTIDAPSRSIERKKGQEHCILAKNKQRKNAIQKNFWPILLWSRLLQTTTR